MMKGRIDYKKIKEFLSTPRGKAFAFLGFYLVFFLILGVSSRMNLSTVDSRDEYSDKYKFSISNIEKNNYHFKYSMSIDNNEFIYEGDRKDNRELFTFQGKSYYRNADTFLKDTNGIWLKVENPYIMKDFIDINNISKILDHASYVSKTDYESGIKTYNYSVTTTTLVQLMDSQNIDLDDIGNTIFIRTDEDDNVDEISFLLDSYCKYKNIGTTCKIDLSYSNFSGIATIEEK